jgi:hypothetical protein
MRAPETLKYGAAKSPGLGQFPFIFRQNNICMSPVVGSQYGAMTEAVESLIAQLRVSALPLFAKTEKLNENVGT